MIWGSSYHTAVGQAWVPGCTPLALTLRRNTDCWDRDLTGSAQKPDALCGSRKCTSVPQRGQQGAELPRPASHGPGTVGRPRGLGPAALGREHMRASREDGPTEESAWNLLCQWLWHPADCP